MNNYIKVKIEGKNVNNYIKWLISKKINIIKLDIIKHDELIILTDYKNFNLLTKYSKTYKINIIKKYGKIKLLDIINKNIIIVCSLVLSIVFIYLLSRLIFSIDVVYNDQNLVNYMKQELEKYDIKKYKTKKGYQYLNTVKQKILEDNRDTLEWMEIIEEGTKYIVKLVERKKETKKEEYPYQSIGATKNAIITEIKAHSGEKIKNLNQYVKKGEIVISGINIKPDGTQIYSKATGTVYGEVWYKVSVEYPYFYKEEKVTGNNKNVLVIHFLNKSIPIFSYKKYKHLKTKDKEIIINNNIPIELVWENQYEVIVEEKIYTKEEVIVKAKELAKEKLLLSNKKINRINEVIILEEETINSKIKLKLFISVNENIAKIIEIKQ